MIEVRFWLAGRGGRGGGAWERGKVVEERAEEDGGPGCRREEKREVEEAKESRTEFESRFDIVASGPGEELSRKKKVSLHHSSSIQLPPPRLLA
jgi:hypothetical protein